MKFGLKFVYYLLVILTVSLLSNGCLKSVEEKKTVSDSPISVVTDSQKPCFFVVLVDETASFGFEDSSGEFVHYWPMILDSVIKIIGNLKPGDGFLLIGIDDRSYETSNVLLGPIVLDDRTLQAKVQTRTLMGQVKVLTRRETNNLGTDILGAIDYAAYYLNKETKHRGVVIGFTDMVPQDASGRKIWPDENAVENINFVNGAEGCFFYVNATGKADWNDILKYWVPAFETVGVEIKVVSENEQFRFYQENETKERQRLSEFLEYLRAKRQ